jgi:hypothetical protein
VLAADKKINQRTGKLYHVDKVRALGNFPDQSGKNPGF